MTIGLISELVRLPVVEFSKLQDLWMLAREDVVLRIRYETHEKNVIMRGHDSGTLTVRAGMSHERLPLASVISCEEMRMQARAILDTQKG